ncbi:MAG: hypothetical protein AAGG75_20760 [Bacteroidota bacterium]
MSKPTILCCLLLLLCGLNACSPESSTTALPPFVNPPIPAFDPEFTSYSFDAAEGLEQDLANGGKISIPPHALLDADGQPVQGRVAARYRELHDAFSIYLAGISMDYEQDSSRTPFATAGTFELRVEQAGELLRLKADQPAQVKLASYQAGEDYQFYYLDEQGRRWDSLGTAVPEVNPLRQKQVRKIKRLQPSLKFPLNRRYMALNYDIIVDVQYNNSNLSKVDHEAVKKRLKGYGLGWQNVETYSAIEFEGRKIPAVLMVWKNIKGRRFPEWTAGRFGKITPISGKRYQLELYSQDSSQHFTCPLLAVMPLKALLAFEPSYWTNNYQAAMAKVREEEERLKLMAEVFRSYEVAELGIYNWDRLIKEEEAISLVANFDFGQNFNTQLSSPEVVYLTDDGQSVIRFPQKDWDRFSLLPSNSGRMFSLLPGQKVAVFTPEDFEQLDYEAIRERAEHTFMMRSEGQSLQSAADFRSLLGI